MSTSLYEEETGGLRREIVSKFFGEEAILDNRTSCNSKRAKVPRVSQKKKIQQSGQYQ